MNYDLSVILSGIRTEKWNQLYMSIENATKKPFEMICVGPDFPPVEFQNRPNVKFFRDFGQPTRCKQIGLQFATGTYTTWASDDAPFLQGGIDGMFDILYRTVLHEKNVVSGKYYEGRQAINSDAIHLSEAYYHLNHHNATRSAHFPNSWLILNMGIINTNYLKSLGGWDCTFEVDAMAHADLAARIQRDGANVFLTDGCVSDIEWSPGNQGDHGPVHNACMENDFPLFQSIYSNPNCVNRIKIPMDNWVKVSPYWERRFS